MQGTSTSTLTSIGIGAEESSQNKEQEHDEELEAPPTSIGRRNHEVLQTLKDVHEFVGAPRLRTRDRRALKRYSGYKALMNQLIYDGLPTMKRLHNTMCGKMLWWRSTTPSC